MKKIFLKIFSYIKNKQRIISEFFIIERTNTQYDNFWEFFDREKQSSKLFVELKLVI